MLRAAHVRLVVHQGLHWRQAASRRPWSVQGRSSLDYGFGRNSLKACCRPPLCAQRT